MLGWLLDFSLVGSLDHAREWMTRMSRNRNEVRLLIGGDCIPDTEELSRAWLHKYVLPEDRPPVMAAISQAIVTKSFFEMQHRVRHTDSSVAWTHSRVVSILNADGEIVEWSGTTRDVHHPQESGEGTKERPRMT